MLPLGTVHVFYAGKQQVVYGHRDFAYMLPGNIRASFIWAPYAANLTTMYTNWYAFATQPPVHASLAAPAGQSPAPREGPAAPA